jgi:hypothetical protein
LYPPALLLFVALSLSSNRNSAPSPLPSRGLPVSQRRPSVILFNADAGFFRLLRTTGLAKRDRTPAAVPTDFPTMLQLSSVRNHFDVGDDEVDVRRELAVLPMPMPMPMPTEFAGKGEAERR